MLHFLEQLIHILLIEIFLACYATSKVTSFMTRTFHSTLSLANAVYFSSVHCITSHSVHCFSMLLFLFPIYILVSQIDSPCKNSDKDIWIYSTFLPGKTHAPSSFLIFPCDTKKIKLWSLCDFFLFLFLHLQSAHILYIIIRILSSPLVSSSSVEAVYDMYIVWQNVSLME